MSVFVLSAPLPHKMISHKIKRESTISCVSELANLLAYCKALVASSEKTSGKQHAIFIDLAVELLSRSLNEYQDGGNQDTSVVTFVQFIITN